MDPPLKKGVSQDSQAENPERQLPAKKKVARKEASSEKESPDDDDGDKKPAAQNYSNEPSIGSPVRKRRGGRKRIAYGGSGSRQGGGGDGEDDDDDYFIHQQLEAITRSTLLRATTTDINAPDPEQGTPPGETPDERRRRLDRINGRRKRTRKLLEIDNLNEQRISLKKKNKRFKRENKHLQDTIGLLRRFRAQGNDPSMIPGVVLAVQSFIPSSSSTASQPTRSPAHGHGSETTAATHVPSVASLPSNQANLSGQLQQHRPSLSSAPGLNNPSFPASVSALASNNQQVSNQQLQFHSQQALLPQGLTEQQVVEQLLQAQRLSQSQHLQGQIMLPAPATGPLFRAPQPRLDPYQQLVLSQLSQRQHQESQLALRPGQLPSLSQSIINSSPLLGSALHLNLLRSFPAPAHGGAAAVGSARAQQAPLPQVPSFDNPAVAAPAIVALQERQQQISAAAPLPITLAALSRPAANAPSAASLTSPGFLSALAQASVSAPLAASMNPPANARQLPAASAHVNAAAAAATSVAAAADVSAPAAPPLPSDSSERRSSSPPPRNVKELKDWLKKHQKKDGSS